MTLKDREARHLEKNKLQLEKDKVLINFIQYTSSFFMLVLGGEITLIGSLFRDSHHLQLAFIAILLMLFACITNLSAAEIRIRSITGLPVYKGRIANWYIKKLSTSLEAEYSRTASAGVLAFLSLLFFIVFVVQTLSKQT